MLLKYRYLILAFFVLLPLLLIALYFHKINLVYNLGKTLKNMQQLGQKRSLEKEKWKRQLARYRQADPFFLQNTLEKIKLLKNEKNQMQKLNAISAFKNNPDFQKRLKKINRPLKFKQKNLKKDFKNKIIESEEISYPVEAASSDIMQLLSLIEEEYISSYQPSSNSPQLIVKKISLSKTPYNTFLTNLNLLKREFLNE